MKILLAGEWQADIHEAAWANGLRALGHHVTPFGWHERFQRGTGIVRRLSARVQNRALIGPLVARLNWDLLRLAIDDRPDVLLLFRGTHIWPGTLRWLKWRRPHLVLATYNNDDPFSHRAAPGLWRHYLRSARITDINLAYRQKSVADLRRFGASGVHLIRSAFVPEKDRPVELGAADHQRFDCDVVFAGHFETDGRLPFLQAVANSGIRFRLFGPDWNRAPDAPWLARLRPIQPLRGQDYTKAIQAAPISLCFLSGLNHDTYTRRCFEVPAIGSLLLCQRSADMEALFIAGVEADYFSDPAELLAKIELYLRDEPRRAKVARAGQAKVYAAGHDITSRMREVERIFQDAIDQTRRTGPDSHGVDHHAGSAVRGLG